MSNQPVKLKINKKNYTLKFDYRLLRLLSKTYKLKNLSEFSKLIESLNIGSGELSFDAIDFIGNLGYFAIVDDISESDLTADDIASYLVFEDKDQLEKIFQAFVDIFPKGEGKQKPAQKGRN